nr:ribbon-helix-helix domain-containing protein [Candidatus Sigynarchaeota archaeon]
MQIVTVNLQNIYIETLDKLHENGRFPSRSEGIRIAIRAFLKHELEMVEGLLDLVEKDADIVVRPAPERKKRVDMRATGLRCSNIDMQLSDEKIASIKNQLGF